MNPLYEIPVERVDYIHDNDLMHADANVSRHGFVPGDIVKIRGAENSPLGVVISVEENKYTFGSQITVCWSEARTIKFSYKKLIETLDEFTEYDE